MSVSNTTKTKRRSSVSRRFNLTLLLLYILSIAIAAPVIYVSTEHQVKAQAGKELKILVRLEPLFIV